MTTTLPGFWRCQHGAAHADGASCQCDRDARIAGRPRIDPTYRSRCATHGESVAMSYIGRERYACWHCATAEYDRLAADPYAGEPASERPER